MKKTSIFYAMLLLIAFSCKNAANEPGDGFKVLAIASTAADHAEMIAEAETLLAKMAGDNGFEIVVSTDTSLISEENLAAYRVFIMLQLAPFDMSARQQAALQRFIDRGNGWVGIHAAGLTGKQFYADSSQYWMWFEHLMGDVVYSPHPELQTGNVTVEDTGHPVMEGLPHEFSLSDEWYEFDKSPRSPNIHVLATADEKSYTPAKPMGDHPMIWINEDYERAIYIGIGHNAEACNNPNFARLLRNAIVWAANGDEEKEIKAVEKSLNDEVAIFVNQLAYDLPGVKTAIVRTTAPLPAGTPFSIIDALTEKTAYTGILGNPQQIEDWFPGVYYSRADFSSFLKPGNYKIAVTEKGKRYSSFSFEIGDNALWSKAIPAITNFFYGQRASSPQELEADKSITLFGSDKTVDLHGGWADASGDISKYFSHLAYTNFMNPQQSPLVAWSMANSVESADNLQATAAVNTVENLKKEAIYGADYILRSLSPEGYFYMTIFTYFNPDPKARRVVGLLANNVTTTDYQCGFREGGGMGVAALARISRWGVAGDYTPDQYLAGAERAFAHLLEYSPQYADDGKENIIDDYCALMGATELWISTGKQLYTDEARKRAKNLAQRLSPHGYFIADDNDRPFWHASDAGMPIIALVRYLDIENDPQMRQSALATIKTAIDYHLSITAETANPFGYPRQSFKYEGNVMNGFFIPHDNESGWWWQGEDARLGSLAAAALAGGRLVYPGNGSYGVQQNIAEFAANCVSWVLGCNPYNICMMYGYGVNNVEHMNAMYGHGTGKGGISNGITGKFGRGDGTGIDFKLDDSSGNGWRWDEQWIPHTAWFLQAVSAMSANK
jgi:type 1 glutamine amidotransferase